MQLTTEQQAATRPLKSCLKDTKGQCGTTSMAIKPSQSMKSCFKGSTSKTTDDLGCKNNKQNLAEDRKMTEQTTGLRASDTTACSTYSSQDIHDHFNWSNINSTKIKVTSIDIMHESAPAFLEAVKPPESRHTPTLSKNRKTTEQNTGLRASDTTACSTYSSQDIHDHFSWSNINSTKIEATNIDTMHESAPAVLEVVKPPESRHTPTLSKYTGLRASGTTVCSTESSNDIFDHFNWSNTNTSKIGATNDTMHESAPAILEAVQPPESRHTPTLSQYTGLRASGTTVSSTKSSNDIFDHFSWTTEINIPKIEEEECSASSSSSSSPSEGGDLVEGNNSMAFGEIESAVKHWKADKERADKKKADKKKKKKKKGSKKKKKEKSRSGEEANSSILLHSASGLLGKSTKTARPEAQRHLGV